VSLDAPTVASPDRLAELRRRLRQTGGRRRKLRGLVELLRPYRWRVLAMLVSLVAATGAALAPAPLAKLAIDQGINHHDVGALNMIVLAFLASAGLYWVATYLETYLVGWVGQRALQDLRIQLFKHLQTLSIGFYSRNRAGVIISRLTNDVEALDQLISDGLATLFQSTLMLLGVIVILFVLDPHLALLTFLALPMRTGSHARRSPRSRATCRRRSRASVSCAPSDRSPVTSSASRSSTKPTGPRT